MFRNGWLAVTLAVASFGVACGGSDKCKALGTVGTTAVTLPLVESQTRAQETPVGDLITDALLEAARGAGAVAAVQNGGAIRGESMCVEGGFRMEIPPGPI